MVHEQREDSRGHYRPYAKQFTAANYDPQAWAELAKEAGVKYVVLTAKHHDGFTLYDSAVFRLERGEGLGRRARPDPAAGRRRAEGGNQVRPLLFAIAGLEQSGRRNGQYPPWDEAQKKGDFDEYLAKIALPQVQEILDKYHPSYLFFDTEYSMTPERAADLRPDVPISRPDHQ